MHDAKLERRLFTPPSFEVSRHGRSPIGTIHKELKRRGVTQLLLWEEYRSEHADG
jgi:hypothetical protein